MESTLIFAVDNRNEPLRIRGNIRNSTGYRSVPGISSVAQIISLWCLFPGFYGRDLYCTSVKRTWSLHALKLSRIAMLKHIVIINLQFYLHKLKSIWISLNFARVSIAQTEFDCSGDLP